MLYGILWRNFRFISHGGGSCCLYQRGFTCFRETAAHPLRDEETIGRNRNPSNRNSEFPTIFQYRAYAGFKKSPTNIGILSNRHYAGTARRAPTIDPVLESVIFGACFFSRLKPPVTSASRKFWPGLVAGAGFTTSSGDRGVCRSRQGE